MPKKKINLNEKQQLLYNELKKLSKRANQRIVRLERNFGKDTWATKRLKDKLSIEKLGAWTKTGRVRANKSLNEIQIQYIIKATTDFLNSKTSTKKGIKAMKKKMIEEIQKKYGSETNDITYEEAESLANFFEDVEVNKITNYIPGSDVLAVIEETREQKNSYEQFYSQMNSIFRYNKGRKY